METIEIKPEIENVKVETINEEDRTEVEKIILELYRL